MISNKLAYIKTTIVFPRSDTRILLGMKKRGLGVGWWNGFGGKLNEHETYEQSAKREVSEEAGIKLTKLVHVANLHFYSGNDLDVVSKAYTSGFTGAPTESDEMRPKFFSFDDLPFDDMWPADRLWIPKVLSSNVLLGFIVLLNKDNSFKGIQETDPQQLENELKV